MVERCTTCNGVNACVQCGSDQHAVCHDDGFVNCQCNEEGYVWDGSQCIPPACESLCDIYTNGACRRACTGCQTCTANGCENACLGGTTCTSGTCQCPSGKHWSGSLGSCVNCLNNGHCNAGQVCNASGNCVADTSDPCDGATCSGSCPNGSCSGGRTCNSPGSCRCPTARPYWSGTQSHATASGSCRACLDNGHCGDRVCAEGVCRDCETNAECGTGKTCTDGRCVTTTDPGDPDPGTVATALTLGLEDVEEGTEKVAFRGTLKTASGTPLVAQPVTLSWAYCKSGTEEQCRAATMASDQTVTTDSSGVFRGTLIDPPVAEFQEGEFLAVRADYTGATTQRFMRLAYEDPGPWFAQHHTSGDNDGPIFVNCPPGQEWDRVQGRCLVPEKADEHEFLKWFIIFIVAEFAAERLLELYRKKKSLPKALGSFFDMGKPSVR